VVYIKILSIKELKYYLRSGIESASLNIIINTSYIENLTFLNDFKFKKLLILCYDDINCKSKNSFNIKHAKKIKRFLKKCNNENLIICCDAGISRSPAVAGAILKYNGFDESIIFNDSKYNPNKYIFELLYKTLSN
jgi:predicted protein tyrosine phosphatase